MDSSVFEDIIPDLGVAGELSNNLKGFEPILDTSGKITGYKTSVGGADTVFPFSSSFVVGSKNDAQNKILPVQAGFHRLLLNCDGSGLAQFPTYKYLNDPIDLTNVNNITFYMSDNPTAYTNIQRYAGVAKNPPSSYSDALNNSTKVGGVVSSATNPAALTLDVSGVSGYYYVFWTAVNTVKGYACSTSIVAVELK